MNLRVVSLGCALAALALVAQGCSATRIQQRTLTPPERAAGLDRNAPYLKAHLKNGSLWVLSRWEVAGDREVVGAGRHFDPNRMMLREGEVRVPIDSVALFETNTTRISPSMAALTVLTVLSATLTIVCIVDPKTCFGSCPTFYVSDGARPVLQAEGFSASVAPALEATDLDALYRARPRHRDFEIEMKNEALETHVVRQANLLAARRPPGGRVAATPSGEFWQITALAPPKRCADPQGDSRAALAILDGIERWSAADSSDLAGRETIELAFERPPGRTLGLVVGARQSLMSTYLFYQSLAYLGRSAGASLAALERGGPAAVEHAGAIGRALGGIDVSVRGVSGAWQPAGRIGETGPLATDVKVVPLPPLPAGDVAVRLRMTRGLWRLDQVALAELAGRVEPIRLHPVSVRRDGVEEPEALAALLDPSRVLVTTRGDAYTLRYRLPPDFSERELFLESRGYYLEWMREEWLAEENPVLAARMLLDPAGSLRDLAPAFKRREPSIEKSFWESRYARP